MAISNEIIQKINIEVDLTEFAKENPGEGLARLVREVKNDGANFTVSRSGDSFSSITVWEGDGRDRKVKNISLTTPQGNFLFHLPFPQARPLTIADIMEKAEVEPDYSTEIQDIVDVIIPVAIPVLRPCPVEVLEAAARQLGISVSIPSLSQVVGEPEIYRVGHVTELDPPDNSTRWIERVEHGLALGTPGSPCLICGSIYNLGEILRVFET